MITKKKKFNKKFQKKYKPQQKLYGSQEQNLLAKVKISLARAKKPWGGTYFYLNCQEQNLLAKVKSLWQEQNLLAKVKSLWQGQRNLGGVPISK